MGDSWGWKKQRSGTSLAAGASRMIRFVIMSNSQQVADIDLSVVPTASPSAFLVQTSDAAY
jgi:hypothetical protein